MQAVEPALRRIAAKRIAGERRSHTLQATELVHEAYLRFVGQTEAAFESRAHFFGACANIMRRILVDHARSRDALKRGGDMTFVPLDLALDKAAPGQGDLVELLALDEALASLAALNSRHARVAEMRLFSGMSFNEIAECLGVSVRTVKYDWRNAKAWLARCHGDEP